MSDERLRDLERAWQTNPEDATAADAYLSELVRLGEVKPHEINLAWRLHRVEDFFVNPGLQGVLIMGSGSPPDPRRVLGVLFGSPPSLARSRSPAVSSPNPQADYHEAWIRREQEERARVERLLEDLG